MKIVLKDCSILIEKYENMKEIFLNKLLLFSGMFNDYFKHRYLDGTVYRVTYDNKLYYVYNNNKGINVHDKDNKITKNIFSDYEQYFITERYSSEEAELHYTVKGITLCKDLFNNMSYTEKEIYIVYNNYLTDEQIDIIKDDYNLVNLYFSNKKYISDKNFDKIAKYEDILLKVTENMMTRNKPLFSIKILNFMEEKGILDKLKNADELRRLMKSTVKEEAEFCNNTDIDISYKDENIRYIFVIRGGFTEMYRKMVKDGKKEDYYEKTILPYFLENLDSFNNELYELIIPSLDEKYITRNIFYKICDLVFNNDMPHILIPLLKFKIFRDEIDINFNELVKNYRLDTVLSIKPELSYDEMNSILNNMSRKDFYGGMYFFHNHFKDYKVAITMLTHYLSILLDNDDKNGFFDENRLSSVNFDLIRKIKSGSTDFNERDKEELKILIHVSNLTK